MHVPKNDRESMISSHPIRNEVREVLIHGPIVDSFREYFSSPEMFYAQGWPDDPGNWPIFAGRMLLPLWERHEKLFALDLSGSGEVIAFYVECPDEYDRLGNIDVALLEGISFHVIECDRDAEEALVFAESIALPHLDRLREALRGPDERMKERLDSYSHFLETGDFK